MAKKKKSEAEIKRAFGAHLKSLIEEKGISVERFALENGIPKTMIYRAVNGVTFPQILGLIKYAEALEVPLSELMEFKYK